MRLTGATLNPKNNRAADAKARMKPLKMKVALLPVRLGGFPGLASAEVLVVVEGEIRCPGCPGGAPGGAAPGLDPWHLPQYRWSRRTRLRHGRPDWVIPAQNFLYIRAILTLLLVLATHPACFPAPGLRAREPTTITGGRGLNVISDPTANCSSDRRLIPEKDVDSTRDRLSKQSVPRPHRSKSTCVRFGGRGFPAFYQVPDSPLVELIASLDESGRRRQPTAVTPSCMPTSPARSSFSDLAPSTWPIKPRSGSNHRTRAGRIRLSEASAV